MKNQKDNNPPFLEEVSEKIETIDINLQRVKYKLYQIAEVFSEAPEHCPDLMESERDLQRALDAFFVDELINAKPVGDA
jgi:hypothetical protein